MKEGIRQDSIFLYRSDDGELLLSSKKLENVVDHKCDGD